MSNKKNIESVTTNPDPSAPAGCLIARGLVNWISQLLMSEVPLYPCQVRHRRKLREKGTALRSQFKNNYFTEM